MNYQSKLYQRKYIEDEIINHYKLKLNIEIIILVKRLNTEMKIKNKIMLLLIIWAKKFIEFKNAQNFIKN